MKKKIKYRKDVKYFIDMVGLASDSVGNVILDGKYAIHQIHPTYSLAIVPPVGVDHPSFNEMVFFTNCLAYDHDLPALIVPVKREALIKPIERGRKSYINNSYYESLAQAYELLNAIRLGPLGYVEFKWSGINEDINLQYTKKYYTASNELCLYSTAIRQLDPLSEFLCYYRIIESISGDNGKRWVSDSLAKLSNYDFGFLEFGSDFTGHNRGRRINVFSVYKKRSLARLVELKSKLNDKSIADYFYNENRCGIAHGKTNIKTYDFKYNIEEISKDIYIIKLLSRIAIEEKIQK